MPFSQVWFISFPGNCIDDSLEHGLTTSRGNSHEKSFGAPRWVRNLGFCHFLKVASLVFLDIAKDCSLGQCLTSSRAETSPNWSWNGLFYSDVVEHPLKLVCLFYWPADPNFSYNAPAEQLIELEPPYIKESLFYVKIGTNIDIAASGKAYRKPVYA